MTSCFSLLVAQGKTICTGSDDATMRIWNPKSGESIHVIKGIELDFNFLFSFLNSKKEVYEKI